MPIRIAMDSMDGNRIRTSLRIHPILKEDELSYLSF